MYGVIRTHQTGELNAEEQLPVKRKTHPRLESVRCVGFLYRRNTLRSSKNAVAAASFPFPNG
jgi:hypothetical protein